MFMRGLLTPEAEGLVIVRAPTFCTRTLLYVVGLWHMALTTGVNVAARPGRFGALGSLAVDAGRFGDAVRVVLAVVDQHHHDRRYAPAGLIEYLDAGVR
jgi:hypothetical protein